jgi:Phosphate-selective porin O and P
MSICDSEPLRARARVSEMLYAPGLRLKLGSLAGQHRGSCVSTLLVASLMLGASTVAVLAAEDGSAATTDQRTNAVLMRKLAAMERRMQALESELKQKRGQTSAPAQAQSGGPRVVTSTRPTATPPQPDDSFAQAAAGTTADATKNAEKNKDLFGVGAPPVPALKIGMYGEIKFGRQQNPAANGQWQNGFDMARLVLLPTYQVTDNITFNAEIEFEHSGTGFDNDDKLHGTAEIEQAFFDLRVNDHFTFRSPGVDLVPISFNNLYHEPTLFYSVQRPELANGLIPSTWAAPSTGVYGKIVDGLNYQFQVSTSAEDFGDDFAHRGDNGAPVAGGYAPGIDGNNALSFAHAPLGDFTQLSNTLAYTGRLSYTPSFIPGFAGSTAVYYSPNVTPRGAYGDDGRVLGTNAMTIVDTEARYRMPNTGLELRAEYAYVNFSNPENLRANNDSLTNLDTGTTNNVGKDMYGYSGEIAYHVKLGTILGSEWEAVPFYRYTRQNLQTGGVFGFDPNESNGSGDMTFHHVGIAVFPNPSLVFKLDYTHILDHSAIGPKSDRILGAVGWLW